ncbi:MAG: hypothetical protein ACRCZE_04415 [Candidatus Altimarinota bacterium]
MTKSPSHQHSHSQSNSRPHPLANFFNCCLGDEPTPISDKVQQLRENLDLTKTEEISPEQFQSGEIILSSDIIIGDLINNFPQIKPYLQEIHPLGMMSPSLHLITMEIFFSDLNLSTEQLAEIYQNLGKQISKSN